MTTREYMEDQDAEEPDDFIISLTAQVSIFNSPYVAKWPFLEIYIKIYSCGHFLKCGIKIDSGTMSLRFFFYYYYF